MGRYPFDANARSGEHTRTLRVLTEDAVELATRVDGPDAASVARSYGPTAQHDQQRPAPRAGTLLSEAGPRRLQVRLPRPRSQRRHVDPRATLEILDVDAVGRPPTPAAIERVVSSALDGGSSRCADAACWAARRRGTPSARRPSGECRPAARPGARRRRAEPRRSPRPVRTRNAGRPPCTRGTHVARRSRATDHDPGRPRPRGSRSGRAVR